MRLLLISSIIFFFLACNSTKQLSSNSNSRGTLKNISLNGKMFTAMFQQRAAEYRALCLQGYNAARMRIDSYAAQTGKPKAMITDIDETILDNSAYAVHQALRDTEYIANDWYEWTAKAAADTMPGAASLLAYAASKNIEVFYITNRYDKERTGTLANLQKFNLPNADEKHLITRQDKTPSSKELRRQQVMQHYEVVLLMGDNLADLSSMFDGKKEEERKANVDALSGEFGKQFIVFPNANYGDWESALYKGNYSLSQAQKDSVIKSVMHGY